MNRYDLQQLSSLRVEEARILLDNRQYLGAYYLLGYAVECALKACIAKLTHEHDFPDLRQVQNSYTHNLDRLFIISGLKDEFESEMRTNTTLAEYWATVKDWSESSRYETNMRSGKARELHSAVTSRKNGVLTWLMKRW